MTIKKYQQIKIIITIIVAVIFSQFFFYQNFVWPVITLIIGSLILLLLRRQVKEVVADERDYANAGKSASLAIQIYSWIAVVIMIILYSLQDTNPTFEPAAITLSYSTCLLMFVYSLIFKFNSQTKFSPNKKKFIVFSIIIAFFLAIFTLRLFSGEDNWVCKDGQWVKHGNPTFEAPKSICK